MKLRVQKKDMFVLQYVTKHPGGQTAPVREALLASVTAGKVGSDSLRAVHPSNRETQGGAAGR